MRIRASDIIWQDCTARHCAIPIDSFANSLPQVLGCTCSPSNHLLIHQRPPTPKLFLNHVFLVIYDRHPEEEPYGEPKPPERDRINQPLQQRSPEPNRDRCSE